MARSAVIFRRRMDVILLLVDFLLKLFVALKAERRRWFIEQLGVVGLMGVMAEETGPDAAGTVLELAGKSVMALIT